MVFDKVKQILEKNHFTVTCFGTGSDAKDYLVRKLAGQNLGFGGSMTLREIGLRDALLPAAAGEPIETYLLSANALAETGEIVNIDGTGNRIAAAYYGPKNLIYIIGRNKLQPDLTSAIDRARNVAGPLNAKRLNKDTPCVEDLKCHDCDSHDRICHGLAITWWPMKGFNSTEVVLIDEDLGY